MKKMLTVFIFLLPLTLIGQFKTGGVCFRFDDNLPLTQMQQIEQVFSKYKYNFCWSVNIDGLPVDGAYLSFIKEMQLKGNEIMDHTPNHGTHVFWTNKILQYYRKSGVDHINGNTVCLELKKISSEKYFSTDSMKIYKNYSVLGSDDRKSRNLKAENLIYDETNNVLMRINSISFDASGKKDSVFFTTFWSERVLFMNPVTIKYSLVNIKDIELTDDAVKRLAEESTRKFSELGIARPSTFIHPGGFHPSISTEQVKKNYGEVFGYTAAATDGGLQCFNDNNSLAPYSMQWGDFSGGENLKEDFNRISDLVAKHYFLIGGNHFWDLKIPFSSYLQNLDTLLKWCSTNNIQVKTYQEIAKTLYSDAQNPFGNIFPKLEIDLNNDSIPDGYKYLRGKICFQKDSANSFFYSSTVGDGTIMEINALAGVEKKNQNISFYARGDVGSIIQILTFCQDRKDTIRFSFTIKDTAWQKYSLRDLRNSLNYFYVPPEIAYIHFKVLSTNTGDKPIDISQIEFIKQSVNIELPPPFLYNVVDDSIVNKINFGIIINKENSKVFIEKYVANVFRPLTEVELSGVFYDTVVTHINDGDSLTFRAYSVMGLEKSEYSTITYKPTSVSLTTHSEVEQKEVADKVVCFPNPFNPAVNIAYSLKKQSFVSIKIFDITGRLIRIIQNNLPQNAGDNIVMWDATNNERRKISSGIYFCVVNILDQNNNNFSYINKIAFIK